MDNESIKILIDVIRNLNNPNWFNWLSIILTIISFFVSTFLVIWNTNRQIKNQNKETYKPRLKLIDFSTVNENNLMPTYCCVSKCMSYYKEHNNYCVYNKLILKNIGNGLAFDITFYDLINGEKIPTFQEYKLDTNQKVLSTEEVEKNGEISFQFECIFNEKYDETNEVLGDPLLIVCNYKDLNNNNYKLLLAYFFKKKVKQYNLIENDCQRSIYYYQENTIYYNHTIKEYFKNYKKILKQIKQDTLNK